MVLTNKQILRMSVPVLLEQALFQLVQAMNLAFISSAGASTLSGVSVVDQITTFMNCAFMVAGIGVSVVIAQLTGQGNEEGVKKVLRQAMTLGLLFAVLGLAAGLFLSRPIVHGLMRGSEAAVLQNASYYFRLNALSYPFYMLYQVSLYSLRGRGETRATMFVTLLQAVINTILAYLLVSVLQLGVRGAGIAIIAARMAGAGCGLFFLRKTGLVQGLRLFDRRLGFAAQKSILRIGLLPGLETAVMAGTKIAIMSMVGRVGTAQLAAIGPGQIGIDLLSLLPLAATVVYPTAVGFAKATLPKKELESYSRKLLGYAVLASVVSHLLLWLFSDLYVGLFSFNEETADTLRRILDIAVWAQAIPWVFSYALPPILRGAGDSTFASVCSAVTVLLVRYPAAYFFCLTLGWGAAGVYAAMFVDFAVKGLLNLLYFLRGKWADKERIELAEC